MKKFKFKINGNNYETVIKSVEENIAVIEVNGTIYKVEIEKELQPVKTQIIVRPTPIPSTDSHPAIAKTSSPDKVKGGSIKAPLPGVILDVFVKEGDEVKIGQRLITLEAMKMENNINSDKEGKVSSIKVNKGDTVMEGDILIIIGE